MNKNPRSAAVIAAAALVFAGILLTDGQKKTATAPGPVAAIPRLVKTVMLKAQSGAARTYFGTIEGTQRADLAFRVAGTLKELPAELGARVKKGDLLARLDDRDFLTRLKQAQSQEAQARAQYNEAASLHQRYSNLYKKRFVAAATYENYQTQLSVARSALRTAQAATAAVRDALKDTELRAPFDGVVTARAVKNYQEAAAKQTILTLQDLSRLEVTFSIPEADMVQGTDPSALRLTARFDAVPNQTFELKLKEFAAQPDAALRTYAVTAVMVPPAGVNLLPGMAVSVTAAQHDESSSAIAIPAEALLERDGRTFVWKCENGAVTRVPVTPGGPVRGGLIAVSGGLRSGERIVAAGAHLLAEGEKVRTLDENERLQ